MRIFLLLFLTIQQIALAQSEGAGKTNWGPYKSDPCFRQLSVSYMCVGYSKQTGTYFYNIKFKNSGSKNIHFDYDSNLSSGERFMHGRFDIGAGQEYVWVSQSFNTPPQSGNNFLSSKVSKFLENGKDDWTLPQFDCNYSTGKWFCADNCESSNNSSNRASISNQNTTYQTQQPNNSAYNKQAELAEVKRVQEITDKSKTYREYYEKATAAGQAGNYDLAISNWNSAIEVAVNDFQRENAQQWLDINKDAKRKTGGQQNQQNLQQKQQQQILYQQEAARSQAQQNSELMQQSITQLGSAIGEIVVANNNLKRAEKELYNKIYSSGSPKPEAVDYFQKYLKYKKRSKKCSWIGLGAGFGGLGLSLFSLLTLENFALSDVGNGIAITGGVIYFAGIPASIRSIKYFGKAHNAVSFKSKVELKPIFVSNKNGAGIGLSIGI